MNLTGKEKFMAFISYWGIIVLIPILAGKDSQYIRFHANQGLVLFIASAAMTVISSLTGMLLNGNGFLTILVMIINLAIVVLSFIFIVVGIMGMVHALTGKMKPLPIIGKFKILK